MLFVLLLGTYAYFHQGGGWNQNSRFVQARAIVESGRLAVNDFLQTPHDRKHQGPVVFEEPLPKEEDVRRDYARLGTLDLSRRGTRLYPNKPPGLTLLILPAYFVLYWLEWLLRRDVDTWGVLTANLYLLTVLSVAVLGAGGGVLLLRAGRRLYPELPTGATVGATLAFAWGTLMFPYATMLFDHVPVAVFLLASFYVLLRLRQEDASPASCALLAGACAGSAVVLNYAAVLAVLALLVYARAGTRVRFALTGLVAPALLLAAYHLACFGRALVLPQSLSVIPIPWTAPRPWVLWQLLFSAYRGLFYSSPVLLLSLYGAWVAWRSGRRAEVALIATVFASFLAMNVCFQNWHGGSSFGPRYLIPTLPFLALTLPPAFARWPRAAGLLALVSIATMTLVTAVDPQTPRTAADPLAEYYLPTVAGQFVPSTYRRGPVSAHTDGVLPAHGETQARWNSFNLGESLFPESLWSLVPLLLGAGYGLFALRQAGGFAEDAAGPDPPRSRY